MTKYVVYAATESGAGVVRTLGKYDNIDEIKIYAGMFNDDVVLWIEKKEEV